MAKNIVENEIKNEVVETVENATTEQLTLDEFKEKTTVKKSIGIASKRAIIDIVMNSCIYENNGMYYIDYLNKDIAFDLAVLNFYTDFIMGENITYDYLKEIGVFDYICDYLDYDDIWEFKTIIDNELEQKINILNSVSAVISRKVDEFINKIPDTKDLQKLLNKLPNAINKLDPEVVKIFTNEMKNGTIQNQVINKTDSNVEKEKVFSADDVKRIIDLQKVVDKSKK